LPGSVAKFSYRFDNTRRQLWHHFFSYRSLYSDALRGHYGGMILVLCITSGSSDCLLPRHLVCEANARPRDFNLPRFSPQTLPPGDLFNLHLAAHRDRVYGRLVGHPALVWRIKSCDPTIHNEDLQVRGHIIGHARNNM